MKKLLTIIITTLIACGSVNAQEYEYDARLGWFPGDLMDLIYRMGEDPVEQTTYGPRKTIGIFAADFNYSIMKWLSVGARLNYRNAWCETKSFTDEGVPVTGIDRLHAVSLIPMVTGTTDQDSVFRYYVSLGIGAGINMSTAENNRYLAFQLIPVGIAVGKKVSWYFECGLGNAYAGFMTGVSWRF
jgi:hypothetical protein